MIGFDLGFPVLLKGLLTGLTYGIIATAAQQIEAVSGLDKARFMALCRSFTAARCDC